MTGRVATGHFMVFFLPPSLSPRYLFSLRHCGTGRLQRTFTRFLSLFPVGKYYIYQCDIQPRYQTYFPISYAFQDLRGREVKKVDELYEGQLTAF